MNILNILSPLCVMSLLFNANFIIAQPIPKTKSTVLGNATKQVIALQPSLIPDNSISLQYVPLTGNQYSYSVASSVSQTLGDMFDFKARTSAHTSMKLTIDKSAKTSVILNYQYDKGRVSLDGLSLAGIPDTTFETDGPLLPELQELINAQGKVIERIHKKSKGISAPVRSEQLLQSLSQGARYFLIEYPVKPIQMDSLWQVNRLDTIHTITLEGNSNIIMNTMLNYLISDVSMHNGIRIATIQCSSNALGFKGTAEQSGIFLTIEGEGSAKGLYKVELHSGIPLEAQLSMEYELRMAATGQENAIFPVTMNMDTKYIRTGFCSVAQPAIIIEQNKQKKRIK